MYYDKTHTDGSVTEASRFERLVLEGVPIIFNLAEWLLVVSAFQYIAIRFDLVAAKVVWWILGAAFGAYVGVLVANSAWRLFRNTYRSRSFLAFGCVVVPAASVGVLVLLNVVVKYLVLGH